MKHVIMSIIVGALVAGGLFLVLPWAPFIVGLCAMISVLPEEFRKE